MGFKLTVTKGKSEGKEFSFTKARVRVGRDHDNDLVLYDLNVSRNHFEIVWDTESYLLRDCGSQNGTRLNDKSTVEGRLSDGDKIRIGGVEFRFSGSDTQPNIPMSERAELFAPKSSEQRAKLEELRTLHKRTPLSQEPATRSMLIGGRKPAWKRILPIVGAALAVVMLVALLVRFYDAKVPDASETRFPLTAEADPRSFGAGRVDVSTPIKTQFEWKSSGGRSILTYVPGGIESEHEVLLELNGAVIAQAPVTGPPWGSPVELKLDRQKLKANEMNLLVFRHHAEPGEARRWGIRDIALQETPLPPPSRELALQALKTADQALQNKRIALANLSVAADNYKKAVLLLEGLLPLPAEHARAEAAMKETEKELDKIVESHLFNAEKARKLGKAEEAESILREALLYLPKSDDPRRKQIEEKMK